MARKGAMLLYAAVTQNSICRMYTACCFCYSQHYHGFFSAGNRYFCMKLFIDQFIVDLKIVKLVDSCGNLVHEQALCAMW